MSSSQSVRERLVPLLCGLASTLLIVTGCANADFGGKSGQGGAGKPAARTDDGDGDGPGDSGDDTVGSSDDADDSDGLVIDGDGDIASTSPSSDTFETLDDYLAAKRCPVVLRYGMLGKDGPTKLKRTFDLQTHGTVHVVAQLEAKAAKALRLSVNGVPCAGTTPNVIAGKVSGNTTCILPVEPGPVDIRAAVDGTGDIERLQARYFVYGKRPVKPDCPTILAEGIVGPEAGTRELKEVVEVTKPGAATLQAHTEVSLHISAATTNVVGSATRCDAGSASHLNNVSLSGSLCFQEVGAGNQELRWGVQNVDGPTSQLKRLGGYYRIDEAGRVVMLGPTTQSKIAASKFTLEKKTVVFARAHFGYVQSASGTAKLLLKIDDQVCGSQTIPPSGSGSHGTVACAIVLDPGEHSIAIESERTGGTITVLTGGYSVFDF